MIDDREVTDFIEAERYELFAAPGYNFHLDRREFIKTFGVGILFVVPLTRAFSQQQESGRGLDNNHCPTTSAPGFISMNRASSLPSPERLNSGKTSGHH